MQDADQLFAKEPLASLVRYAGATVRAGTEGPRFMEGRLKANESVQMTPFDTVYLAVSRLLAVCGDVPKLSPLTWAAVLDTVRDIYPLRWVDITSLPQSIASLFDAEAGMNAEGEWHISAERAITEVERTTIRELHELTLPQLLAATAVAERCVASGQSFNSCLEQVVSESALARFHC